MLYGQQPEAASSTARDLELPVLDTFPFVFTYPAAPEKSFPADDTLPDYAFRMYDPARRQVIDWGTLGNIGSSGRPLLFQTTPRLGFDHGFHSFDLYQLQPEALQFFRNTRAFTDLFFSQGRIQDDNQLRARFSRTFSGGLNFSLAYQTFNHLGQYRYQAVKHSALSFGVWYPFSSRYEIFLIYTSNTDKQQENGGIVEGTVFGSGQFSGPIDAEVQLPDAQALTRHANRNYHLTQHLKLFGGRDSTARKRVLRLSHTAEWDSRTFKFSDPGTNPGSSLRRDSLYFDTFMVDKRGIRNYLEVRQLDNHITLNTFKAKQAGRPSDVLALGLMHRLLILGQEPLADSTFSNVFLTGDLKINPSDKFLLEASGKLGMLANFGEYQVKGILQVGLGKAGVLQAGLLSQRYPPARLYDRLYVSQRLLWQHAFSKPVETSLSATYSLPSVGFEASAHTHLINNYLYYDQRGIAAQTSAPVQVAQLILRENLKLGRLRFDNTVALQQTNRQEVLRLPKWFSKNSLYYSGPLFKKRMLVDAGVDFRVNSAFTPDGYQPVTAQFYLQDSLEAQAYPWLDVFLAFKVKSFRVFVRYENIASLWDPQTAYYQTAYHPQPFGALRVGIGWRFMDSTVAEPENINAANGAGGAPPTSTTPGGRRN